MPDHIYNNQSHKEILNLHADKIPVFLFAWLEEIVESAEEYEKYGYTQEEVEDLENKLENAEDTISDLSIEIDALTDKLRNAEDRISELVEKLGLDVNN